MMVTSLAIIASAILIALAVYAGYLLRQLKKQTLLQQQQQTFAQQKRNANIFESVNTLCLAGIQGQCDLSEASIRLYSIMDYVQGDDRIDFERDFPAISELYHIVHEMARGEDRQALSKPQRMQQNLTRHKSEQRLQEAIMEELTQLQKQVKPLNQQIDIKII